MAKFMPESIVGYFVVRVRYVVVKRSRSLSDEFLVILMP